jgi:ATP-binding cassette subfamily B protein
LSEDLVDKIVGHRTRAIQQGPALRHTREDRELAAYALGLAKLDGLAVAVFALPRVYVLCAGAVIAVGFVRGASSDAILVAGIGIFLGTQALGMFASAIERGVGLLAAYRAIRPLFEAGRRRERPFHDLDAEQAADGLPTVLAGAAVSFAYREGGRMILRDVDVRIHRGERVLVEGPSGGGKTTFVKLVAGELAPLSGTMLVGGLDVSSVSDAQWRKVVASVPQFHENHVFSNTFSFNVDPRHGRRVLTEEAEEICRELGLDDVLARMPAGHTQLLGETGWQLSHGERSRLFIARALLQGAKLVIFDESFGALDPVNLARVVDCVRRRASTLLVIAHV